jgi:hypothetical protein
MRAIRGDDISMIFQDPMTSLIRFTLSASKSPKRCGCIAG